MHDPPFLLKLCCVSYCLVILVALVNECRAQSSGYDLAQGKSYTVNQDGYSQWTYVATDSDFVATGVTRPDDATFLTDRRYEDEAVTPRAMTFANLDPVSTSDVLIVVDLQSPMYVSGATVKGLCCGTGGARPTQVKVHSSSDQSSWTLQATRALTSAETSPSSIQTYSVTTAIGGAPAARYWRLTVTIPAASFVQLRTVSLWQ